MLEFSHSGEGPESHQTSPDNAPLFELAPNMRVGGVIAVIAHHEVATRRHFHLVEVVAELILELLNLVFVGSVILASGEVFRYGVPW